MSLVATSLKFLHYILNKYFPYIYSVNLYVLVFKVCLVITSFERYYPGLLKLFAFLYVSLLASFLFNINLLSFVAFLSLNVSILGIIYISYFDSRIKSKHPLIYKMLVCFFLLTIMFCIYTLFCLFILKMDPYNGESGSNRPSPPRGDGGPKPPKGPGPGPQDNVFQEDEEDRKRRKNMMDDLRRRGAVVHDNRARQRVSEAQYKKRKKEQSETDMQKRVNEMITLENIRQENIRHENIRQENLIRSQEQYDRWRNEGNHKNIPHHGNFGKILNNE